MAISKREFVECPLYNTDIPRVDCGGCEYNIRVASINKCGFCRLSHRERQLSRISERDDILKQYSEDQE